MSTLESRAIASHKFAQLFAFTYTADYKLPKLPPLDFELISLWRKMEDPYNDKFTVFRWAEELAAVENRVFSGVATGRGAGAALSGVGGGVGGNLASNIASALGGGETTDRFHAALLRLLRSRLHLVMIVFNSLFSSHIIPFHDKEVAVHVNVDSFFERLRQETTAIAATVATTHGGGGIAPAPAPASTLSAEAAEDWRSLAGVDIEQLAVVLLMTATGGAAPSSSSSSVSYQQWIKIFELRLVATVQLLELARAVHDALLRLNSVAFLRLLPRASAVRHLVLHRAPGAFPGGEVVKTFRACPLVGFALKICSASLARGVLAFHEELGYGASALATAALLTPPPLAAAASSSAAPLSSAAADSKSDQPTAATATCGCSAASSPPPQQHAAVANAGSAQSQPAVPGGKAVGAPQVPAVKAASAATQPVGAPTAQQEQQQQGGLMSRVFGAAKSWFGGGTSAAATAPSKPQPEQPVTTATAVVATSQQQPQHKHAGHDDAKHEQQAQPPVYVTFTGFHLLRAIGSESLIAAIDSIVFPSKALLGRMGVTAGWEPSAVPSIAANVRCYFLVFQRPLPPRDASPHPTGSAAPPLGRGSTVSSVDAPQPQLVRCRNGSVSLLAAAAASMAAAERDSAHRGHRRSHSGSSSESSQSRSSSLGRIDTSRRQRVGSVAPSATQPQPPSAAPYLLRACLSSSCVDQDVAARVADFARPLTTTQAVFNGAFGTRETSSMQAVVRGEFANPCFCFAAVMVTPPPVAELRPREAQTMVCTDLVAKINAFIVGWNRSNDLGTISDRLGKIRVHSTLDGLF